MPGISSKLFFSLFSFFTTYLLMLMGDSLPKYRVSGSAAIRPLTRTSSHDSRDPPFRTRSQYRGELARSTSLLGCGDGAIPNQPDPLRWHCSVFPKGCEGASNLLYSRIRSHGDQQSKGGTAKPATRVFLCVCVCVCVCVLIFCVLLVLLMVVGRGGEVVLFLCF